MMLVVFLVCISLLLHNLGYHIWNTSQVKILVSLQTRSLDFRLVTDERAWL